MMHNKNNPTISFISIGFEETSLNSQDILTQLITQGYDILDDYINADLSIINLCCHLNTDTQTALSTIIETSKPTGKIIIISLYDTHLKNLTNNHSKIVAILTPKSHQAIIEQVHKNLPKSKENPISESVNTTPAHYAYLQISENNEQKKTNRPHTNEDSRPALREITSIVAEAEQLAQSGVQEILLTSDYLDSYISPFFSTGCKTATYLITLCQQLASLGLWIRLPCIPTHICTDKIISLMTDGTVLPYLNISLQHTTNTPNRGTNQATLDNTLVECIDKWRQSIPDIAIRSAITIGYPTETEEKFNELVELLSAIRLNRLSISLHTDNKIPEAIKQKRFIKLTELQDNISTELLADKIGSIQPVIIDDLIIDEEVENIALGRTIYDAPNIDGIVQVEEIYGAEPGQIIHVEIIDSSEHDLIAIPA